MARINRTLLINSTVLASARSKANGEGKNLNQVLGALLTAYAQKKGVARAKPGAGASTNFEIDIELPNTVIGDAQDQIMAENTTADQLLIELIAGYAQGGASSGGADSCRPIPNERYATLNIDGRKTDRPANIHADINLALRGYTPSNAQPALIDLSGDTDTNCPQLYELFKDKRVPGFSKCYCVHEWSWGTPPNDPGTKGSPITKWPVTLVAMQTTPGETLHVPNAGYDIGNGYKVLVLYAEAERITLKYTREDTVDGGYTIHVEDCCVEPSLLALYNQQGNFGRSHLPALKAGQAFGRAKGSEIKVALRDNGQIMDPRSRKDWWRGR